jgi:transcription antitermination factor NusG
MFMAVDERPKLQPIVSAFTPEVFAELSRKALEISESLETRQPQRYAEVYPDVTPHWHVATVLPGRERAAAEDMSDRRFGVYLPESEFIVVRRGRKFETTRLMLPGYVLVFVWDVDRHMERIRACEGVRGMLFHDGRVAIVPDRLVDKVREAENRERPLKGLISAAPVKKQKRCWRKSRRSEGDRAAEAVDEIMAVHSYSPFIEALRQEADGDRLSAFHKALGLTP